MSTIYKDDEQLLNEFKELIGQISKEVINYSVLVDLKNTQKGIENSMLIIKSAFNDIMSKFIQNLNDLILDAEKCYSEVPAKVELLNKSISDLDLINKNFSELLNNSSILEELKTLGSLIDSMDKGNKENFSLLNDQVCQVIIQQGDLELKLATMNIKMQSEFEEIKEFQKKFFEAIKNDHS